MTSSLGPSKKPKISLIVSNTTNNTHVQQLHNTLSKCAKENPTLTTELCNIIVHALKEDKSNASQDLLEEAINRMNTMSETEFSFPKMLNYEWTKSNEVPQIPEDQSDDRDKESVVTSNQQIDEEEKNSQPEHFEDDEKVDKPIQDIKDDKDTEQLQSDTLSPSAYNPFTPYKLVESPTNHTTDTTLIHYSPRNKPK